MAKEDKIDKKEAVAEKKVLILRRKKLKKIF